MSVLDTRPQGYDGLGDEMEAPRHLSYSYIDNDLEYCLASLLIRAYTGCRSFLEGCEIGIWDFVEDFRIVGPW